MQETPPEPAAGLPAVPDGLSTGQVLLVLQSPERRQLLRFLDRLETSERLSALARSLAMARDAAADPEQILLRLYHTHVPKLVEAGLATFDEAAKTVALTWKGERLAAALEP